jgi:hypothetical protein
MGYEGVRPTGGGWPEGLTDLEAVQRLRTLCLAACDGVQDLADDNRYKALRRALLKRADLRSLAPPFIAAQPNLQAYVRHVRETRDRGERRDMVRAQFSPLFDHVGDPHMACSSAWTGRLSPREQAEVVQAIAPAALTVVQRLIDNEMRLRGNGGPVDEDREQALQHLRALHEALGELIRLAEAEQPLDEALGTLQTIRRSAVASVGRVIATVPVTASALLGFAGVAGLTELLLGNVVVSLAAGALVGNTVKDSMLRQDRKKD